MSQPVPIAEVMPEVMQSLADAKAAYDRARLRVIPALCTTCEIDTPGQKACNFTDDPACKHKPLFDRRIQNRGQAARCKAARVPPRYADEVLKDLDYCSALRAVNAVLRGDSLAAVLLGTPGSGKTLFGCYALSMRGGLFLPASMLDVLSAEVAALIERACVEPVLVLDDVGQGRSATVLALDRTENILCRRYDAGLPSIPTANLTRSEWWALHAIGNGRLIDRIGEDSITACREASRRQPQKEATDSRHFAERGEK